MIKFDDITGTEQLFQWVAEHHGPAISLDEINLRFDQYMGLIGTALQAVPEDDQMYNCSDGSIRDTTGGFYNTFVLSRTADKVNIWRICFVMDAQDKIIDVVYMTPDDPRAGLMSASVH